MNFMQKIGEFEMREIFQYWLERKPADGVPSRASIDPRTIPHKYLPDLFLYERDTGDRFRCRLAGTGLTSVLGRDETGKHLDDLLGPLLTAEELNSVTVAISRGIPVYCRYRGLGASGIPRSFSRILLPLSSDDGRVNQIFGMVCFGPVECRRSELGRSLRKARTAEIVIAENRDMAVGGKRQPVGSTFQNRFLTAVL